VESRIEAAEGTASFLRDEEQALRRQINEVQRDIAAIRTANPGVDTINTGVNQSIVQRLTTEIQRTEERIQASEQELSLLHMQQPLLIDAGEEKDSTRIELREKRRTLASLKRRYTDTYPDVIALTDEVLSLEAELEPEAFRRRARDVEVSINEQLAATNLDEQEIGELRNRLEAIAELRNTASPTGTTTSLARISFEANEQILSQRLNGLNKRLGDARQELMEAEDRLDRLPAVSAQVATLKAEETRLQNLLSRTQEKRAIAERSENLESQQKAERVLILEAPIRPDVPTSPDKPKLAMLIVGAAGGLSAALAFAPIFLFPKVETGRQMNHVIPHAVVIEVPEIADDDERTFRRNVTIGLVAITAILGVIALVLAVKTLL
ncbi:MAG: hypothetical protein AAF692_12120, partial [Pseudomonadota bacterium]